jgi:hypothetical protein
MNTLHHAFWTYVLFRKKQHLAKWFVAGAVWPDVIYFAMFLSLVVQSESLGASVIGEILTSPLFLFYSDPSSLEEARDFVCKLFEHPTVHFVRVAIHSILIWATAFLFSAIKSGLKLSPLNAFLWGWLGHILIDLLTHVRDATPLLWPASDIVIPGPLSYWDPQYNGAEFSAINSLFTGIAIVYLLYKAWSKRYKRRLKLSDGLSSQGEREI